MTKIKYVNNEIVTALCSDCKCCLANSSHCFVCHTKKSIDKLCGCGTCETRIDDYVTRLEIQRQRHSEMLKVRELHAAA